LTHVITRDGYPLVSPEYAAFSLEKMYAETKEGFREILKSEQMIDLPYKILIQEGNLWPAIEELIKTYNIDLLVVGARGVGAVRYLWPCCVRPAPIIRPKIGDVRCSILGPRGNEETCV
jgi:nucleotide-binding universal stress UspA family protein